MKGIRWTLSGGREQDGPCQGVGNKTDHVNQKVNLKGRTCMLFGVSSQCVVLWMIVLKK